MWKCLKNKDGRLLMLILSILMVLFISSIFIPVPVKQVMIGQSAAKFEQTIQETIGSVVHVRNDSQGWQGSGVHIGEGLILTARHVVEGGTQFRIRGENGKIVKATRALSSKKYDVGFIQIDEPVDFGIARLEKMEDVPLGRQVYCIGSPYGEINFNSVTLGIVSGVNRNWDSIDYNTGNPYGWSVAFTTDAAGHPGNSGCPVFTMDGKVRGILVGGYSPVLICCMPVDLMIDDIFYIKTIFRQNKYRIEVAPQNTDMYNHYFVPTGEDWMPCQKQKKEN